MVETIGVLVLIGLLTMGSVTGYNYLVQRYRRQEVAREVAQLVTGIKSSGAARMHDDGDVIPAGEFVSGMGVDKATGALQFADGEHSYAVVTQLANGAFAVNLQLEPGTCNTVLDTLNNEDAIMFAPLGKNAGQIRSTDEMARVSEEWLRRGESVQGVKLSRKVANLEDQKNMIEC